MWIAGAAERWQDFYDKASPQLRASLPEHPSNPVAELNKHGIQSAAS